MNILQISFHCYNYNQSISNQSLKNKQINWQLFPVIGKIRVINNDIYFSTTTAATATAATATATTTTKGNRYKHYLLVYYRTFTI